MAKGKKITMYVVFFVLIFFSQVENGLKTYTTIPIHYWDEHDWIAKSYQAESYKEKSPLWDEYSAYDQPPLVGYANYLFLYRTYRNYRHKGELYKDFLLRHNFLLFGGDQTPIPWGKDPLITSGITKDQLIKMFGTGIKKTINLIYVVRKHNVILWTINISALLLLTQALSGSSLLGVGVAMLIGLNIALTKYGLMAQSETLFLTLFNLNILLFLVLRHKKSLVWTGILALFGALLFQTKINGIMIGIFVFIYFMWHKQWVKVALYTGLFLLFSILLNPTLMHWDFLWRIYHYFEIRYAAENYQINLFPTTHILNTWNGVILFFDHFFFGKERVYYNIFLPYSWVYNILFLVWILGIIEQWKKQKIIPILFIFVLIITVLYLRLDWERYWLHLSFFVYYFEAVGLFFICNLVIKIFKKIYVKITNTTFLYKKPSNEQM